MTVKTWPALRPRVVAEVGADDLARAHGRNQAYIDAGRLAERRTALGLTQANVAERARDENLLVVAAVEGYSRRRRVPARDTILTFASVGLLRLIRDSYPVLHTQSLDESVDFAEDVLTRSGVQLADSYPGSNAEGSVSDERFMYKDQDVTLDVTLKIEHVVNIIAREQCLGFDDAYEDFVSSRTYQALQKPMSLMWAESAEYIVDRYLEEWSDRQHDLPVAASREAS